MKYIKKITYKEWDDALKKAYGKLTQEEFWDLRFAVANDKCICYSTIDDSCFYLYDTVIDNFIYFALEKKVQNIKGLYEVMLELVYNGIPYVHYNGRKGRYNILEKAGFMFIVNDTTKNIDSENDFKVVYAAHPYNIWLLNKKLGNKEDKNNEYTTFYEKRNKEKQ
jgi:hypothetical protein